jgi:thiol-disulfide isomerase/thioredoxin
MRQTILALIIALTTFTVSAKDKVIVNPEYEFSNSGNTHITKIELGKNETRSKEMPAAVSRWIDDELAKAKRKTLMDFESGEFFAADTARLIGYIKGYDSSAGFSTGMIYVGNVITREDYPIVIQIHEDGRFECSIPMNYPEYSYSVFASRNIARFYLQPGQTLAMFLDWEEFLMADRLGNAPYTFKNARFQGVAAGINNELSAFHAQLPELPVRKIYDGMKGKTPDEFKSFIDECLSDYSRAYQRLLETEKLSEPVKIFLKNNYQIMYSTYLFEYETNNRSSQIPLEFYDFLRDISLNNKELLSTENFPTFINRLEYCQPFMAARNQPYRGLTPEKTFEQYLFEELNIPKSSEDEIYFHIRDSITSKLKSPDITPEARNKIVREYMTATEKFKERHGKKHFEDYEKKYMDDVKRRLHVEFAYYEWKNKDSIYTNVLKLKPGIVYDMTKIRSLDYTFRERLKDDREEAWNFLSVLTSDIPEQFLRKEADRLYLKNFPVESRAAYGLPDTHEANFFKELIAPFKDKILLVDFWATSCGPCIATIRQQKTLREKYKDSPNVSFVFITSENESPLRQCKIINDTFYFVNL